MNNQTKCPTIGGVLYPPLQQIYDRKKESEVVEYLGSLKTSPLAISGGRSQPNETESIKPE